MNIALVARGCFVAGTDTEVGKTAVSAALLHLLGADGSRTAGCKPVAAGMVTRDGLCFNEDVRALRDASSLDLRDAKVGPCQLTVACAPHNEANVAALVERLATPCLGVVPRLAPPTPLAVAAHLDIATLRAYLNLIPSPGVA